jgi:hypothetical protein
LRAIAPPLSRKALESGQQATFDDQREGSSVSSLSIDIRQLRAARTERHAGPPLEARQHAQVRSARALS